MGYALSCLVIEVRCETIPKLKSIAVSGSERALTTQFHKHGVSHAEIGLENTIR
ncbi:unnamed protein product [marine sediment metagenome]|uniref:Uncharacterized protein n=1 Tax=marine sediment metagenome TaxID=412755 RepID=X1BDL9_9ZZZZ